MPIFHPFRALGYITDAAPFNVQRRGRETFVTVSVGKAWQIYNCAKLTLVFVGPQLEKRIRALASWRDYTFAAYGHNIAVFNRAHQVATLCGHTGKVVQLMQFGDLIISVGADRQILIWPVEAHKADRKPIGEITLSEGFVPTCMMHPDTYLNKILVGSEKGQLQLWNIHSNKLVHEFKGWGSAVRCCASSPALDTVAVGCADGKVRVLNLKYDETLLTLSHASDEPVTALSFRSDGQPLLAAGGLTGVISLWNLEQRKLQTVINDAHDAAIMSLHFFPREPVLLSSSADNSIKMWIFDSEDGEARLLRFRSGHSSPPACVRYYAKGTHILSAGQDRAFRVFSTIQDQQSRELSQRHVGKRAMRHRVKEEELKLPRVVSFAAAEIRERDWCNVVTCHEGESSAYTWRLQNFVIGEHVLRPPGGEPSPIKAVVISACGNFAILGTAAGRVERFNMQSGLHRGSYQAAKQQYSPAHQGAVVGLASDSRNLHLFTGGYDGFVKVWDFKKGKPKLSIDVGSPLVKMTYHRGNGLLVTASDDWLLRVYDAVAGRLVRKFEGHADRITDLCISQDGRWLITASMDFTVRTWNLVTARQLDCMRCDVAVTGLSLSPAMDMLATIHVNRNGIYLWANKVMYSGLEEGDVFGSGKATEAVPLPTISTGVAENDEDKDTAGVAFVERGTDDMAAGEGEGEEKNRVGKMLGGGTQLTPELISLAMLPRSQWQNLINLDIIKERNKPIEPVKKPDKAPFFLPTIPSLSGDLLFAPTTPNQGDSEADDSRAASRVKRHRPAESFRSEFSRRLHEGTEARDYTQLVELLRDMSPSAVDLELRMMEIISDVDSAAEEDVREVEMLLHFLAMETASKRNFELIQAVTHRSLTIHGDVISRHTRLKEKAKELLDKQAATWKSLDDLFQNVRCMVGFLGNTRH